MRKLASIQKIEEVSAIEGADQIVKVRVLGWQCIAKKGEFSPGDKCVYFEIDSLLPEHPLFEFVKRGSKKATALLVKTLKLRGVISQGLAMPAAILEQFSYSGNYEIGEEVTDTIGVKKYDPQQQSSKARRTRTFPAFIPKTEEMRIQSCPEILSEIDGIALYATVKLDGCSATYAHKDGEFFVCSRNQSLGELLVANPRKTADLYWYIAEKYHKTLQEMLPSLGNFAVQGEICGPGVQKNKLELDDLDFFAFNVWDIDKQEYLSRDSFIETCGYLGVKHVPFFSLEETPKTVEEWLKLAEGKYEGTQNEREGLVVRPVLERYSQVLRDRLSFKVISNAFLLAGK